MSAFIKDTDGGRLKLHEAVGVTALVALVAVGVVVSFAALATRGLFLGVFKKSK